MTYSFLNDYSEGCHPKILQSLLDSNAQQEVGYGDDAISEKAKALFKRKSNQPNLQVHFVTGGTQANLVCLASMLQPFEAIVSASTGHIATNEAGAIEAIGHKIISMPSADGKLTVADIEAAVSGFSRHPHTVRVKVVYITNATEAGTVYNKAELSAIAECCRKHDLYLFMDGARLAHALASTHNDMSLADIAELTDMFWFGGTKNGGLLAEAILISNPALQADFGFHLKQRGALLAKGRVLGTQFATLLDDDLYLELATHANSMAQKISAAIAHAGYPLLAETHTNQVFALLPHELIAKLQTQFSFYEWEKREEGSLVRLVTSWATVEAQVDAFVAMLG